VRHLTSRGALGMPALESAEAGGPAFAAMRAVPLGLGWTRGLRGPRLRWSRGSRRGRGLHWSRGSRGAGACRWSRGSRSGRSLRLLAACVYPCLIANEKFSIRMCASEPTCHLVLCDEVAIGGDGVGASGVLPISVFAELHDTGASLCGQLAFGMPLDEWP